VLRGKTDDVQHFGEHVIAERGVRHGKIVRMPFEPTGTMQLTPHSHDGEHHSHDGEHHHGAAAAKPARRPKRARKARR
jgi:CopG family nickel-responsive transcriptional regulator